MILLKILIVTWTIEVVVALVVEHKERIKDKKTKKYQEGLFMTKRIIKTQVNKDILCKDHIGKPVLNYFGETIGAITDAVELDMTIELTMEIDNAMAFIKPTTQSFEIVSK